ncbi:hypothetical protein AGMMS49965_18530 [Bacteroidia bacterium]|nr:hypothetical protein AGMMS49965_18530 [Bacteroidia bacterium]
MTFIVYLYFTKKEYRQKTKTAFFITIAGLIIGLCVLYGHFVYHGHPKSFFWQFSQSATISTILHKIPFLSDSIVPLEKISATGHSAFYEFIDCYLKNKNYAILTAVNIIVLAFLLIKTKIKRQSIEVLFLGFSLVMPTVMFFAGHCLSPYTWMFYLPAVLLCVICIENHNPVFLKGVYGGVTILFTVVSGLPRTLINSDKTAHDRITQFVEKQNLDKDVVIMSSYSAYYPVRKITKNCYFPIYPAEYRPEHIEYILTDDTDGFACEGLNSYLQTARDKGCEITPVDSMPTPRMVLYRLAPCNNQKSE